MGKEQFLHAETRPLFQTLEEISQRSGVSRGQSFENVIRASVAALAAETMEDQYFEAIKEHTEGKQGKRGVDLFPKFLGQAVNAISESETDKDILGDLFQGSVSYGENSLYLTPEPVASLMSRLTSSSENAEGDKGTKRTPGIQISDPCCGTGIMLMESARNHPNATLVGQDVDSRCCDIASINLGLRGLYGYIICGNTISREVRHVYEIGSFFHETENGLRRGVIRLIEPEACPVLPEQHDRNDELSSDDDPKADKAATEQSMVIGIPQWLFRMEMQRLADLKGKSGAANPKSQSPDSAVPKDKTPSPQEKRSGDDDDHPTVQGELF